MYELSMYSASVPVFARMLANLDAILDKAVVYADEKKIDHAVLLNARLAPDMLPLTSQVQIATDLARGCVARLADVDRPVYEDNESSFADLKARVAKTIDFMTALQPEAIKGTEAKEIELNIGKMKLNFTGADYLLHFTNANVFFHITTTYNILRHNGVELGKLDFIGSL